MNRIFLNLRGREMDRRVTVFKLNPMVRNDFEQ